MTIFTLVFTCSSEAESWNCSQNHVLSNKDMSHTHTHTQARSLSFSVSLDTHTHAHSHHFNRWSHHWWTFVSFALLPFKLTVSRALMLGLFLFVHLNCLRSYVTIKRTNSKWMTVYSLNKTNKQHQHKHSGKDVWNFLSNPSALRFAHHPLVAINLQHRLGPALFLRHGKQLSIDIKSNTHKKNLHTQTHTTNCLPPSYSTMANSILMLDSTNEGSV